MTILQPFLSTEEWTFVSGRAFVAGIDGKTVGNTVLVIPTRRRLLIQQVIIVPTEVDTLTVPADVSVGKTSPTYSDIVDTVSLYGLTTVDSYIILAPAVNANVLQPDDSLVLRVSTGATATTFTFKAIVVGLFL